MMKIIDWYLAKKFLTTLIFILLATGIISVVFDLAEKTEDFLKYDPSLYEIVVVYYLNFMPTIINLISPLVIFISALYFTARLANNSEILPLLSGGVSYWRLLMPYLAVGCLLCAADALLKNYVLPKSYANVMWFEDRYIAGGLRVESTETHLRLDKSTHFYTQGYDWGSNRAYKFGLDRFDKEGNLVFKLRSTEATYDTLDKLWRVRNFTIRRIAGLRESIESGDTMSLKLPISNLDFNATSRRAAAMTTPELNSFIAGEKAKGKSQLNYFYVEKYKRISMPFGIPILIMIAVGIATRKVRGGIGMHLLVGILIAICYELVLRFSTTFSTNAGLPPVIAVWIPNVVYGALAVVVLKRTPK